MFRIKIFSTSTTLISYQYVSFDQAQAEANIYRKTHRCYIEQLMQFGNLSVWTEIKDKPFKVLKTFQFEVAEDSGLSVLG